MKNVVRNASWWLGGCTAAGAGVLLARVIARQADPARRLPLTVAGQLLALVGLWLICVGVSRRLQRDASRQSPSSSP